MIYHLVVGDEAAKALQAAVSAEEGLLTGEVVTLRDILHVGPLQRGEGQSFSDLRSAFWSDVVPAEKGPVQVDDLERLLEVSTALYKDNDAVAWIWMAPCPADVMAYFWVLPYLGKHAGRCFIINATALPFLDAAGKVFYPKNFSELQPRELIKARKLARPVTPAEVELDGDEWKRLAEENGGIRTLEGGKKMASRPIEHYDAALLSFVGGNFAKASKVIFNLMKEKGVPTGDLVLAWRLRTLAAAGKIELRGDVTKSLRDWDVRIAGGEGAESVPAGEQSATTA